MLNRKASTRVIHLLCFVCIFSLALCAVIIFMNKNNAESKIKRIVSSGHHAVVLKDDGSVWTWGRNVEGQLGDGTQVNRSNPVQVKGLKGVIAVAAGAGYTMALKEDGTIWIWGLNVPEQLGDGTVVDKKEPMQVKGLS